MMRRFFTLLLAFVIVMTLAACGHGGGADENQIPEST